MDLDIDIKPTVLVDDSRVKVKEEESDLDIDIKPAVLIDESDVKKEESNEFPTMAGRFTEDVMCPGDESFPDSARTYPRKRQMKREKEAIEKQPSLTLSDEVRQRVLTIARTIQNPFGPRQFFKAYTRSFGYSDIPSEMLDHSRVELVTFFDDFYEICPYSEVSFVYVGSDAFDGIIHANEVASIQKNITDLMRELNKPMRTAEIWIAYRMKYGEPTALQEHKNQEFIFQHFLLVHPGLKHTKRTHHSLFRLRISYFADRAYCGATISGELEEEEGELTSARHDKSRLPDLQKKITDLMKTFKEPVTTGEICCAYKKKYREQFAPKSCIQSKLELFFMQHPKLSWELSGRGTLFKIKEDRPDEEMEEDGASSSKESEGQEEGEENSSTSDFEKFLNKVRTVGREFPSRFSAKKLLKAFSGRYHSNLLDVAKQFGYESLLKLVSVIPEIGATKRGGMFFWVGEPIENEKKEELKELQEKIMDVVKGMESVGVMKIIQEYCKAYGQFIPYHKFGYKNARRCLLGIPELRSRLKEQSVKRSEVGVRRFD